MVKEALIVNDSISTTTNDFKGYSVVKNIGDKKTISNTWTILYQIPEMQPMEETIIKFDGTTPGAIVTNLLQYDELILTFNISTTYGGKIQCVFYRIPSEENAHALLYPTYDNIVGTTQKAYTQRRVTIKISKSNNSIDISKAYSIIWDYTSESSVTTKIKDNESNYLILNKIIGIKYIN